MQLDKTCIAIRERGISDTLDLALHVVRAYAWPLVLALGLGVVPLAIWNHFLIGWMMVDETSGFAAPETLGGLFRYGWTMAVLVVIEAPLASVFATMYLGQAVFLSRPRMMQIVRDVFALSPRIVWYHLLLRGVLPAWLLAAAIDRESAISGAEWLLVLLFLLINLRRSTAPYVNEIILLERNPLRADGRRGMTVQRRSVMLHGPSGGDLVYRWVICSFYAVLLFGSLLGSMFCLQGVFLDDWAPSTGMMQVAVPLAMWLTAGFFTVVRFLSYLDLRIRHEGWEVELRMRAEAARLVEQAT